jgi:hypothetical protein
MLLSFEEKPFLLEGSIILTDKHLLLRNLEEKYGEKFKEHYLEIYRIYVGMADKISERRQSANSFFLAINTAIVGLVSYLQLGQNEKTGSIFYLVISVAGMIICYIWYRLVLSYKQINSGKFRVVHLIEQNLPLAPYDAEWEILGRGEDPKKYLPFSHIEMFVPWVFFGLHAFVFLYGLSELIRLAVPH